MATKAKRLREIAVPTVNIITATEVEALYDKSVRLEELKKALAEVTAEYSAAEKEIIGRVESGWSRESTARSFTISVDTRRNVKWREEFEKALGPAKALAVIGNVEPTVYKHVHFNGADVKP